METSGSTNYIKSVSAFITETFEKIANIATEGSVWFRGEDSENYSLLPNIYRTTSKEKQYFNDIENAKAIYQTEQNIDSDFNRKSSVFFANKGIQSNLWNRYFLKQHYGVKTRLLDWTENALFALFFAICNDKKFDKNGKVWILSPYKLNKYSVSMISKSGTDEKYNIIFTCNELKKKGPLHVENKIVITELLRRYYRMDFTENEKMYPIAIYPPHLDERMSAQQACFTLFGNIVRGIDCNNTQEKFLECVYIDAGSKFKILKELRTLEISFYSVYPDLDGLGKTINYDRHQDIFNANDRNELSNVMKHFGND